MAMNCPQLTPAILINNYTKNDRLQDISTFGQVAQPDVSYYSFPLVLIHFSQY